MADLSEEYRLGPGWDEMFAELGVPRESYEALHATLQPLSSAELRVRAEVLARAFLDQGITFALKGVERTAFDVHAAHESLTVTASSTVETLPPGDQTTAGDSASWDDVARHADRWYELILPTRRTGLDGELGAVVADLRGRHATPQEAAMAVCDFVRAEVAYVPGSTGVQSDALHAWAQRSGVCQDISHLAVGMLRQMGLPARYVSGYLHPKPGAAIGESVVGQSHAWVEWWAGRWTSYDPTNGVPVGERHVVVGRGREYDDVPPLKGIYSGPRSTGQGVEVTITRLR